MGGAYMTPFLSHKWARCITGQVIVAEGGPVISLQ